MSTSSIYCQIRFGTLRVIQYDHFFLFSWDRIFLLFFALFYNKILHASFINGEINCLHAFAKWHHFIHVTNSHIGIRVNGHMLSMGSIN